MRRNIVRISLALVLILSLCLSISSPAMAAKPEEKNGNKPVASVTWTGSNGKVKDEMSDHLVYKFHVKKLSDGSVAGEAWMKYLNAGFTYEYELVDVYFAIEDGYNVAYVLVTVVLPYEVAPGVFVDLTWFMCWRFEDRGEPGKGNDIGSNYVYGVPNIDLSLVPWPISSDPALPWGVFMKPQAAGQIQVKITDAYYDL